MTRRKTASVLPVHMNGRIYDPLLGRFLSADKVIDGALTVQGYNRYSYVKNNPLTMVDMNGYQGGRKYSKATLAAKARGRQRTKEHVAGAVISVARNATETFVMVLHVATDSPGTAENMEAAGDAAANAVADAMGVSADSANVQDGETAANVASLAAGGAALAKGLAKKGGKLVDGAIDRLKKTDVDTSSPSQTGDVADTVSAPTSIADDAVAPNTGANNAASGQNLKKQLASEQSTADIASGNGERMAGAGTKTEFRDAAQKAETYGGDAADYAKVKGSSTDISKTTGYGDKIETHAVENTKTGEILEEKTKLF